MSFPRWRLPVLSLLVPALVFLAASFPVEAATGWKLWKGNELVGVVAPRQDGRLTLVGVSAMARLLGLSVSNDKKDTLVICGDGGTLELVRDAAAGRFNGRIRPLANPVVCDEGDWWVESRAALRLFNDVMGLTGSGRHLRWAGVQEISHPETPSEPKSDSCEKSSPSSEIDRRLAEMTQDIAEGASGKRPLPPQSSPARDGVRRLRWGRQEGGPRAVFDLDGPLEPKIFRKPGKTVVIFKAPVAGKVGDLEPGNGIHGSVVYHEDHVDFTFTHPESVEVRDFALTHPDRYVLDFLLAPEKDGEKDIPSVQESPASLPTAPAVPERKGSPLVVIDPGHGGKDPGAVANGLREKDLNLQIAKRLRAHLLKQGCKVRLTREDDRYLKLSQRTALANQWGADVFVSVHINALPAGRHARGVEIYLMALPSDKDAMQLALIENKDLENGNGASHSDKRTRMLLQILGDMQQNAKINESTGLAEVMFSRGRKGGLPMRRVAQAPFYVLRGAGMPSVLLELGFITEKSEARKLKDPAYQDKLARNLAGGISEYVSRNP